MILLSLSLSLSSSLSSAYYARDKNEKKAIAWSYLCLFTDNVAMEMFLELIEENELLLAVAYDEASEK